MAAAVAAHRDYVAAEVLAVELVVGPAAPDAHDHHRRRAVRCGVDLSTR